MSDIEKIVLKMRNKPNDIRFCELEKVLNHIGFYATRQKGSHKRFKNVQTQESLTIPVQDPMKSVYIKKTLKMMEGI